MDVGQTDEDPSLTDDLKVVIRDDGSVGVAGGVGVLVASEDVDPYWARWLVERGIAPGARCWALQDLPGPDGVLWAHAACGWRWIGTNGDPIVDGEDGFDLLWERIVEEGQELGDDWQK